MTDSSAAVFAAMSSASALMLRRISLSAGSSRREVLVRIVDATLPDDSGLVAVWGAFTRQFPFESKTRIETDARRLAELGVTVDQSLPAPGTKGEVFHGLVSNAFHLSCGWCNSYTFSAVFNATNGQQLTPKQIADITNGAHRVVARAKELGLDPSRYAVDLPDEPGRRNAAIVGEMARAINEAEPGLLVYMNPCFWEGGFPPEKAMLDCIAPYYNEFIDVSVPIRDLVRPTNTLTKELWTAKRAVNAQYIHPASRAGRSIAWASFECGLDGFAYYCYYSPCGNPWDIRTWGGLHYGYQMVFPLENDVAITPIYETMRDAAEDFRLLRALRDAGKEDALADLVPRWRKAKDAPSTGDTPDTSTFQGLHDAALARAVEPLNR